MHDLNLVRRKPQVNPDFRNFAEGYMRVFYTILLYLFGRNLMCPLQNHQCHVRQKKGGRIGAKKGLILKENNENWQLNMIHDPGLGPGLGENSILSMMNSWHS